MERVSTGVLIIGSGGAGLRCAIELKRNGYEDLLVVGARKLKDAHTVLASGGVNAVLKTMDEEDSWEVHAADTYHEGQYLANPHLVEKLVKGAPEAIDDLLSFGAKFHLEENGKISQRFFGAHSFRRTVFKGDETGKEIMRVLVDEAEKLNVKYLENLYIFQLLVEDGVIKGSLGITHDNKLLMIEAKRVVLATGGYANIYKRSSSRENENYGNAIIMAYDAGALIGDLELVQFHPTGLVHPAEMSHYLVSEAVRAEGGILKNAFGERFMQKYDPERLELSTRDVVARANYFEIKEGNGTPHGGVLLDISSRSAQYLKERVTNVYTMLKKNYNIDISKSAIEVAPTAHFTMGGIQFDSESFETAVKGLYAIGECTMGVHGANRLGGNSLAEILVFGKILGEKIASERAGERNPVSESLLNKLEKELTSLEKEGEELGSIITDRVREIMWNKVGIVRSKIEMEEALKYLTELDDKASRNGLISKKSLKANIICNHRVSSVVKLAKLLTTAALERKESRGAHYRTDYKNSEKEYLCNFLFEKDDKNDKLIKRSVPEPSDQFDKAVKTTVRTKNYKHLE